MDVLALGLWTYGMLAALVAADSVLPLVPSEAMVIAATTLAAGGDLSVPGVFAAAAIGALTGDLVTYLLGRNVGISGFGQRIRSPRSRRLRSLMDRVRAVGWPTVVFGRFVPVGRTGIAVLAGINRMPATVYLAAAVVGSLAWATYMTALGRIGGLVATSLVAQVAIGVGIGLVLVAMVQQLGRAGRAGAAWCRAD